MYFYHIVPQPPTPPKFAVTFQPTQLCVLSVVSSISLKCLESSMC